MILNTQVHDGGDEQELIEWRSPLGQAYPFNHSRWSHHDSLCAQTL